MKIIKIPKFGTELELLSYESNEKIYSKYFGDVNAGFPSPAEDMLSDKLSLDERYISNPNNTFILKCGGSSMLPTLQLGDLLIVKTDAELMNNDIVIVSFNNSDYTVKRFNKKKNEFTADNSEFKNIEVLEDDIVQCLGIVKHIIRDL